MLLIRTCQNIHLSADDATTIAERLTNPGSEFQRECWDVVAYHNGRCRAHSLPHVPMALIYRTDEQTGEPVLIGWGATRMWRGTQTYECFVDKAHRGKGLGSAALSCLTVDGWMDRSREVAVFNTPAARLARKAGFTIVRLYLRNDFGVWVPSTGELVESSIVTIPPSKSAAPEEHETSGSGV